MNTSVSPAAWAHRRFATAGHLSPLSGIPGTVQSRFEIRDRAMSIPCERKARDGFSSPSCAPSDLLQYGPYPLHEIALVELIGVVR